MGLGGFNTGGNSTFLRIGMGKDDKGRDRAVIGKRAKEGDPGAVLVYKKENEVALDAKGNPVYRTEYGFIEGMVQRIFRKPGFDEKENSALGIEINTGDTTYTLDLGRGDDYWLDFALRCDDIDWAKSVRLTPYSIPQDNNPKYSNRYLVPSQGGQKIERKWKVEWLREVPEGFTADPSKPYPFVYDADENEWKRGKAWNWLDGGPIQRAIDKVAFLNTAPEVVGDDTPPEAANEPPVDDLPF